MMTAERSGADDGGLQRSMLIRATMRQAGIPCQIRDMRPSRGAEATHKMFRLVTPGSTDRLAASSHSHNNH
jgi:hypothetical protein